MALTLRHQRSPGTRQPHLGWRFWTMLWASGALVGSAISTLACTVVLLLA